MSTKNDITGDELTSGAATGAYRDNWERIFGPKVDASIHPGREAIARKLPDHAIGSLVKIKDAGDECRVVNCALSQSPILYELYRVSDGMQFFRDEREIEAVVKSTPAAAFFHYGDVLERFRLGTPFVSVKAYPKDEAVNVVTTRPHITVSPEVFAFYITRWPNLDVKHLPNVSLVYRVEYCVSSYEQDKYLIGSWDSYKNVFKIYE